MNIFNIESRVIEVERNLKNLIDSINNMGGAIYITDSNNKDFSIKLDRTININYFVPMYNNNYNNTTNFEENKV